MKKILLLVTSLVLVFGLAACGGDDEPDLTEITLSGIADVEIEAETAFNVFTGVTALGDDDVDYTTDITADSEKCDIADNGDVDTSSAVTCVINYTVVVDGKLQRGSMTLTIKPKVIIIEDAPVLIDWDFQTEDDLEGWGIYTTGDGSVVMTVEDGAMKLVTTAGGNRWDTRIDYMNIPFEQGYDYKVSFKMKSDIDGKKVHLNLGELLTAAPYFDPFKPEEVDIITVGLEYQEFFYTFNMEDDNQRGGILFEMGDLPDSVDLDATLWIKDLKIEGGSDTDTQAPMINGAEDVILMVGDTFDVNAGVTAEDFKEGDVSSSIVVGGDTVNTAVEGVYEVTYTANDSSDNSITITRTVDVVSLVLDPNNNDQVNEAFGANQLFTDDVTNAWYTTVTWGEPIFTAEIVDGKLVMTGAKDGTKDYGTDPWNHIVRWSEMTLVNGAVYKVVFDGMTDETGILADDNNIMVKVEAGLFSFEEEVHIGTTATTIEFLFKYTGETTTTGSLLFFVGGREHVITVEDLMIYVNSAGAETDTDPVVTTQDLLMKAGDAVELLDLVTASDVEDGDLVPVVTVLGPNDETVFDNNIAGDWVITYTVTDSDGNTVSATATVSILAGYSFIDTVWTAWYGDEWSGLTTSEVSIVNGELVVDVIYEGTPATYATQIYQEGFEVENGKFYRITFDARADEAKDILVAFGDALDHDPWFTDFVAKQTVTLGTDMMTYVIEFEMTEPTTADQGKLVFELATAVNTKVYFDNVMIEEITALLGDVVVGTNQVVDGTFEDTTPELVFEESEWTAWYGDEWSGVTTSQILIVNGELVVDVIYEGTPATYATQVYQENFEVENGKFYRITFDARADEAKDILVAFGDALDHDPWFTDFVAKQTVTLGTDMMTYVIEFEMTEPTTADQGKLVFELATAVNTKVYIDNVMFEEITALLGDVVEETNQVVDGTFEVIPVPELVFEESEWTAWYGDEWSGVTTSQVLIVNGELVVDVVYEGTPATYATQIYQENFEVENGKFYRITFDARADEAKDILVAFGDALDHDPWFTDFVAKQTVTLGTDMMTYVIEFEMTEPTTADQGKLVFELATAVNTKVYIDNVMLEEITALLGDVVDGTEQVIHGEFEVEEIEEPGEEPVVYDYVNDTNNDALNDVFDTDTVLDFVESNPWFMSTGWGAPIFTASTTSGVMTIVHTKDGEADFGGAFWDDIVRYQNLTLINGAHYKVVFDATTDIVANEAGSMLLKIEGGGFATETTLTFVDTVDTYEFEFVWNGATVNNGLLLFMIGGVEHTLTIENLDLLIDSTDAALPQVPMMSGVKSEKLDTGATVDLLDGVTAWDVEDGELTPVVTVLGPEDVTVFDGSDGVWTITYTVTDSDMNETVMVVTKVIGTYEATTILTNNNFDGDDLIGWLATGNATNLSVAWGEASVHWTDTGANPWDVKAEAQGLVFEQGATYVVTFDARANADRDFGFSIYDATGSSTVYNSGPLSITAGGNSDWGWTRGAYVVVFTYDSANPGNLEFQLGNFGEGVSGGSQFDFDNIMIYKLVETPTE